jgi:hypothetical protein
MAFTTLGINNNDGTRHRPQQALHEQPQERPHQGAAANVSPRTATSTPHPRRRRSRPSHRQSSQLQDYTYYSYSKLLSFFVLGFGLFQVFHTLGGLPVPLLPETSTPASTTWNHGGGSTASHPRVLLGIFSTDDLVESKRRQAIRKTYLSYYTSRINDKNISSFDNTTDKNRICSLPEFLHKTTITSRRHDGDPQHLYAPVLDEKECQLIYAFVVGINATANTANNLPIDQKMLQDGTKNTRYDDFDDFNLVEPFLRGELDPSELGRFGNSSVLSNADPDEESSPSSSSLPFSFSRWNDDLVLLNISENMNKGKSESWFLYATQLWKRHMNRMNNNNKMDNGDSGHAPSSTQELLPIDYLAKCDSDTLLFPEIFLDQLLENLPSHPQNSYFAGSRYSTIRRKGRYFLAGGCYLLSWELSNYVTSQDCPRTKLYLGTEDKSMGNYIWSYNKNKEHGNTDQQTIQTINVLAKGVEWMVHGTKDPMQLQKMWNRRYDGTTRRHNTK